MAKSYEPSILVRLGFSDELDIDMYIIRARMLYLAKMRLLCCLLRGLDRRTFLLHISLARPIK